VFLLELLDYSLLVRQAKLIVVLIMITVTVMRMVMMMVTVAMEELPTLSLLA
jgi:hypothetical protein